MAKPLSAWELKEQVRKAAERRRQTVRRMGVIAVIAVIFSAAGLFELKSSRANLPAPAVAAVAVSDTAAAPTPAPRAFSTSITPGSNLLSLTGSSASPSLDATDLSVAGAGVSLTPAAPR